MRDQRDFPRSSVVQPTCGRCASGWWRLASVHDLCNGEREGAEMIEAHNLTKRYGPKTAVEDLSFMVKAGLVTGFLGPNGSGKSTTMRLILGLDAPSDGEVAA